MVTVTLSADSVECLDVFNMEAASPGVLVIVAAKLAALLEMTLRFVASIAYLVGVMPSVVKNRE